MPKKSTQKRITERGTILINFEVPKDMHDKLREFAIQEDRTISSVIRQAIMKYLE